MSGDFTRAVRRIADLPTVVHLSDRHGNLYAPVPVEELDEWAWLLARIEDFFLCGGSEVEDAWASVHHQPGGGLKLDDALWTLGTFITRMRQFQRGELGQP